MEQNDDLDQGDEMMLPGFRFHPTDEELVTFYLRRKVQQRPLSIELIKQLDIYKFDPWDLPKEMAAIGEREWYFYCPRDRKYRNSNRPNRVTSAGFWKATGTDRPIYSSDGTKCVGLKKSLVFYKGRAAKGTKTDWMMHEFRLPPFTVSSPSKKPIDKDLLPNDSWAICRIFKKITVRQRASPRMWAPSMMDTTVESNYSYINFNTDITEPQEIIANVYTSPSSTNSFSSHITTGNHNINGFQYLNYEQSTNMAFGSCGLGHAKSIPFSLPARSISLPNLEFSDTSTATATDPSHCNHTSAVKSPQMHPIEDSDPKTHHQVSLDPHPGGWIDHHQQEAEALLENTNMSGSIIPPCVLLSQSDLYDVLKSVTAGPWDTPTPNIL